MTQAATGSDPPNTAALQLVGGYRPPVAGYDEMVDRLGTLRPHWAHVGQVLDGLGVDELGRRRAEAARLLDDDGVTYNIYGTARPTSRWSLDPVPVLITSAEWSGIESAVVQRAELLNLILADLYGPRDLLRRRLLPPEAVLGHGGFLRACDQIRIPGVQQLFTVASDVARDSDGQFWVLADRAQSPSGAGYALQNRSVVSRVFPSLHRDAQVHRLAPFFRALRAGLEAVAPPSSNEPRIVVLSPGPLSETAFEHALLASRLGYSLVEGSDLTFRDGRIWVRSLGRREPVDVILRRVDSGFCDPLELRPDSQLGVPGLVEACRRGTVTVVNTLGSSVLENPGLLPFLPRLAQTLLGAELEMPSIPTWWCGDPAGLDHVLANLEHLVLKPLSREAGAAAVFGWNLSRLDLDAVSDRIESRPSAWVGQAQLALASVPTLTDRGLEARRSVLRTFCVARDDSYLAMTGGLTRVATSHQAVISSQTGALSKDTWVLASEPEKMTGLWLDSGRIVAAIEPGGSMSSRAAENLFWLGRYAERAEDTVRLMRVVHDRRNDFAHDTNPAGKACLRALLLALTDVTATYPGFVGGAGLDDPGPELESLALDDGRAGTLAYSVRRLLDAAHTVRDQLSLDTWLVISGLHRELLDQPRLGRSTLAQVLGSLLALAGLGAESMVRDFGWRFMDAGRRIERGCQLAALLRSTVTVEHDAGTESLLLESVLTTAESIITYRRRYRSHAHLETMLDLLILDPDNPRSLAHQVDLLLEDVRALPVGAGAPRVSEAEKHALETSTVLRLVDTATLAVSRPELAGFLGRVIDGLHATADAIARANFETQLPQRSVLTPADPGAARVLEGVPVMRYRVTHRTTYRYQEKVSASYGQMHLLPRTADGQTCRTTRVAIDPAPDDLREHVDFFGNRAAFFAIHSEHTSLTVTTTSDLSVNRSGVGLLGGQPWEQVRERTASPTIEDGWESTDFLIDSPLVAASPSLADYAAESFTPGRPVLEALLDLAQRIHADFEYEPGSTSVTTTVGDVLAARKGVCQDFAHLAIGCLRSLGLAARYVSGYLETEPPAGQERRQGADVSHAWAALWVPESGWVDIDPTDQQFVDDRYVTTAWGRDYTDVPPLKGVIFTQGLEHELDVVVDVVRLDDPG